MNYGHPGVLTIPQLAMEELQQTAGVEIKDIPFRSGPQSMTELLGGRLDVVSIVMGTEVGQNIRVIGVFSEKRIATFPDVPTIKEQGYDVTPASFGGLLAPLGTPPAVVSKLSQACANAAKDEVYVTTAKRAGQPDDYYSDAEAFRRVSPGTSKARPACWRGSRRNKIKEPRREAGVLNFTDLSGAYFGCPVSGSTCCIAFAGAVWYCPVGCAWTPAAPAHRSSCSAAERQPAD